MKDNKLPEAAEFTEYFHAQDPEVMKKAIAFVNFINDMSAYELGVAEKISNDKKLKKILKEASAWKRLKKFGF